MYGLAKNNETNKTVIITKDSPMSQIYHIELKSSVSERLDLSDEVTHKLNLTPILDQESMLTILKSVLVANGFQESKTNPQQLTKLNGRQEQVTFDLEKLEVKVALSESKTLNASVSVRESYDTDFDTNSDARARAQQNLKKEEDLAKSKLKSELGLKQKELTQKLNDNLALQQREFNQIMQQVYAESIKQKAGQMGEVMEINESTVDGQYELVIKVEC